MNNKPTFPFENITSLTGLLKEFKKNILKEIEVITPAEVIEYQREKNRVVVKSMLYEVLYNSTIERQPFIDIPVFNFGGGGFFINFPLKKGDKGWLLASDKDISIFKQNLTLSKQNTNMRHRYDQSFFLPDKINNHLPNDNKLYIGNTQDNITIENQKIELNTTETNINSQTNINNNLTITGNTQANTLSTSGELSAGNGATGVFVSADNKTITVANGIITSII